MITQHLSDAQRKEAVLALIRDSCTEILKIHRNRASDFLQGGKYFNFSEQQKQQSRSASLTSDLVESLFGAAGSVRERARNASIMFTNGIVLQRKNNVLEFVNSLPLEERDRMSERATQAHKQFKQAFKSRSEQILKKHKEDFKKQIEKGQERVEVNARRIQEASAFADSDTFIRSVEQLEREFADLKNAQGGPASKTQKVKWLKEQLDVYRKVPEFKETAARKKVVIAYSKDGKQLSPEALKATLVLLLS